MKKMKFHMESGRVNTWLRALMALFKFDPFQPGLRKTLKEYEEFVRWRWER